MKAARVALLLGCLTALRLQGTVIKVEVQRGPVQQKLALSGMIEPFDSVAVPVKWYGLVKRVPVQVGQSVKKGDLLAEVEMQYLESTGKFLASRKAFLDNQLVQTKLDEELVASQYKRQRDLASRQLISQSVVEELQMKLLDRKMRRATVESGLRECARETAENQKKLREANYYSPTDGVVSELLVDPKQVVGSFVVRDGQTLARIDKAERYMLKATALDTQAAALKVGQPCQLYMEGTTARIPCRVLEIRTAEYGAKDGLPLFEIVFVFVKSGPLLHRGLLANVEVETASSASTITLPWNTIGQNEYGSFVRKFQQDGSVIEQKVTLGIRGQHRVEVLTGVREGEEVEAALW